MLKMPGFSVIFRRCGLLAAGYLAIGTWATAQESEPAGANQAAQVIQQMDRNQDGILSVGEIPLRLRSKVAEIARRAGLSSSDELRVERLVAAVGGANSEANAAEDEKKSSKTSTAEVPTVAGFGVAEELPVVPGFDVPPGQVGDPRPLEERYQRKVIEYVDRIFRRYDENDDQLIEGEEWKRVNWGDPSPEESDTNKDGKLSRDEMCERIAKRWGDETRITKTTSGSTSGSTASSSKSDSRSDSKENDSNGKIRRYAESLLRQYDENKNGVLERDEWSKMRGKPEESDANGDGRLTLDELTARLTNYAKKSDSGSKKPSSSVASSSSYSSRSRSSSSRDASRSGDKKTYRFLSPLERLPKGLPDWFARNDANGDGQIAMAEFAPTMTDAKAQEFQELDLNGDGVITASEGVAAGKSK